MAAPDPNDMNGWWPPPAPNETPVEAGARLRDMEEHLLDARMTARNSFDRTQLALQRTSALAAIFSPRNNDEEAEWAARNVGNQHSLYKQHSLWLTQRILHDEARMRLNDVNRAINGIRDARRHYAPAAPPNKRQKRE